MIDYSLTKHKLASQNTWTSPPKSSKMSLLLLPPFYVHEIFNKNKVKFDGDDDDGDDHTKGLLRFIQVMWDFSRH